ncbi:MAG: 16S rRNA methyltransferase [Promethearchaeati archaeon SRVP18_Atabeyarchaeia-1]
MITLILGESSLEVIPPPLRSNPIIIRQARKRGLKVSSMLLDASIHHQLINGLPDQTRRGRPDIVHITLLSVLGSPLCKENLMRVCIHTRDDYVISVDSSTRLPRVYNRFTGLMSQLFDAGKVPPSSEKPLLKLERGTMPNLIKQLDPSSVTLFTRIGEPATVEDTMRHLSEESRPAIVIGGFAHGHLTEENTKLAQRRISIDKSMLETWVVASRAVYEYERAIGLPSRRIGKN